MAILRSLVALVLIGGTWWSMADVAWSSGFFQAEFSRALATEPRRDDGGGLDFIDDHSFSDCCADLHRGRNVAVTAVVLGGFPVAALAFVLSLARKKPFAPAAEPALLAAYIFQFAALIITGIFSALFLPYASRDEFPAVAYVCVTAVASAGALPLWHRLRMLEA